ncbi:hypothetical protein MXE38_11575 [Anaerobiospirillum sp. NML120448]|uniref:hypothetical protein n=1 Tax=Anaerobiospirillum sp. NML120448 TaxID=2932816 RepID=UPI001FF66F97|nr:hypothetical protein [Anaerobiospirillum sp. NML120448]MCK0515471.1 hypothetical protein [Anaerobiospirillum sp. NML120448]
MKWYQAHLRVMSHLFELGLFDEVNSCYRKYCLESTPSAYEKLVSLVAVGDIKIYCDELSPQNLAKNVLTTSNIVIYYYKAIAGFTMFKALQNVKGVKLHKIAVNDEMPTNYYQVLFEPNGELKEDVVISAFKEKAFNGSPKGFVGHFTRFNYNECLTDSSFKLEPLADYGFFNPIKCDFTSNEAQHAIRGYNSSNKIPTPSKASKSKEINYFHIDGELDSGFGLLKVIDLLGMHLLLVAQRRQYIFERTRYDDLRSNYKALEQVNSNDIVRLHNNALAACGVFHNAQKNLLSVNGQFIDFNEIVKSYVGRNDALYQYAYYFYDLFVQLNPNSNCTNGENSWEVGYYYFNFYNPFMYLANLQAKLLVNVNNLLSLDLNLIRGYSDQLPYDQEILNIIVGSIPTNIYDICAHFAPSFKNRFHSHPNSVNFEDIVSSVMSYSNKFNRISPTLPYPIREGSEYAIEDYGDPNWVNREERDINSIHECLGLEVLNDPAPIVFSRNLNIYLDIFCILSSFIELYHNVYLSTILRTNKAFKTTPYASFVFDLAYSGKDWVKFVFPDYELLLKDETFKSLIEYHQACFENLLLILDLQGESHLLYEDSYTSNLLRKTNNFDEEFANSLTLNEPVSNGANRPLLSKAEQLLLNKTCISYLQDCKKFCQISKELANKTIELDILLNERFETFILNKTAILNNIYELFLTHIGVLSQDAVTELENVPDDLKLSNDLTNEEVGIEVSQSFYRCVYETFLAFCAKDINLFIKETIPYISIATKEDFAQSLNSFSLIINSKANVKKVNYIILIAFKRFMLINNYQPSVDKLLCNNVFVLNSTLRMLLVPYIVSTTYILIALVKYFVRIVDSITKIKQVEENQECLNIVYNIVHKFSKFLSSTPAKIQNLEALVDQGNMMLTELFEYKSYLSETVDLFSLLESMCLKYTSFDSAFGFIYEICEISKYIKLFKDLLEDTPKVLQSIDVNYFKNFGDNNQEANIPYFEDQNYISIDDDFGQEIMAIYDERLSSIQLSIVKRFFDEFVSDNIESEDNKFYGDEDDFFPFFYPFARRKPRAKKITKSKERFVNLVMEKMRLLDDVELHQLLNLESQKIATQIVDSSTSASKGKAKAKTTTAKSKTAATKSQATAATKSKAQKVATKDTADADVIIEAIEAEVKPKAKSTRSKAKKAEATAESEAESKPKAKSTTKATATKSRAKKVAAVDSTEAKADEDAEAKPKKKAATARTTSKASASTRTKKSTAKS